MPHVREPIPELSSDAQAFIVLLLAEVNHLWDDWASFRTKRSLGLDAGMDLDYLDAALAQAESVLTEFDQFNDPGSDCDPLEYMERVNAARKKLTVAQLIRREPYQDGNKYAHPHHD